VRTLKSEKCFKSTVSRGSTGGVYFGGENINAVTCILAAIDLSQQLTWFASSVRDIRILRLEELNDLMPAIQQG